MESRIEKAVNLFKGGYNCAQSVFVAYADLFELDEETALRISSGFGGGIGGTRSVCGTVSGMTLVVGLKSGTFTPNDKEGKKKNYADVQLLISKFQEQHGSIICKELLGLENCSIPVNKKPCVEYVRFCAELIEKKLLKEKE